ncbi:MAG: formate/nitrite transporter family protein [Clostridia bacterium]|nr:formate/nitrite transporter family protein [Clostridia bacterium]
MQETQYSASPTLWKTLKKAIAAGMVIGVGATVYLVSENKIIGAVLFSIGLFLICSFGMNLFTGKIGYVIGTKNKPNCPVIWGGNLIGCLITSGLVRIAKPTLHETAAAMVEKKLAQNYLSVVILAFFCGILMYAAVENFRLHADSISGIVGIFMSVTVFILCGFEHSIADMCYCIFAVVTVRQALRSLLFLLVVSVFNGLGALALRWLTKSEAS